MTPRSRTRTSLLPWISIGYVGLAVTGATLAVVFGLNPFVRTAWLDTKGIEAAAVSIVLGTALGVLAVIATRRLLRTAEWANALHDKLRPTVRNMDGSGLIVMAVLSAFGEEIFFRGFLFSIAGIVLSSIAFGILHQVRGVGRIGWAISAFIMGILLAALYGITGQLVGCIVAHAIINAVNLRYIRDHEPFRRKVAKS